jgi:mRNA (guanine-N7-)-methyltransferase
LNSDIAQISLNEAMSRHLNLMDPKFEAEFICANPYRDSISDKLSQVAAFDLVSSQFSFHYCFESKENVEAAFVNIQRHLKKGGLFIATVPDPVVLK